MQSAASSQYDQMSYRRNSRSNSPISDADTYDLSYLYLNEDSLSIEISNDKKNRQNTIRSLIICNNLLSCLPDSLSVFRHIETLDVSSNQLKKISSNIMQAMPNLRHLIAKDNLLSDNSLPKNFGATNRLEIVNFSGNKFTQYPYQLLEITTLREIYLGSNQIMVLPRNYENLFNLEILYLGGNRIVNVPAELSQLKRLTSLNLSDNQLTILPTKLNLLKNLRTLSLHGNELTTLPIELIKLNLSELSLRNNPLVNRFAKEFIYEVPSLLELSARCVKTKKVPFQESNLPYHLINYLDSATCCLNPNCRGVYFTSKVEHVKFVDFCGRYRIPLMQYLCSSICNEKISNRTRLISGSSIEESDDDDNSKLLKKILLG